MKDTIVKEGYIEVKGKRFWKKVWVVVLDSGRVSMSREKGGVGRSLALKGATVYITNVFGKSCSWSLDTPWRLYYLAVENVKLKEEWIHAFSQEGVHVNCAHLGATNRNMLISNTQFNADEVDLYYQLFQAKFTALSVDRKTFVDHIICPISGGSESFWNRVFDYMSKDDCMDFISFCIGMDMIKRLSVEEKLSWAFDFYDKDGDGLLTLEDINHIFYTKIFFKNRDDEPINDLYDLFNNDLKITKDIFVLYMKNHSLLVDTVFNYIEEHLQNLIRILTIQYFQIKLLDIKERTRCYMMQWDISLNR
jgi:Ca2+-binding EF-hand superfamily protein